jgi:hypothetical protein
MRFILWVRFDLFFFYFLGSFNNDKLSWNVNHELNIVVSGQEECDKMKSTIDHLRKMSVPVDPHIRVGLIRYLRIKLWDHGFIKLGNWISNKKIAYETEKHFREFVELKEMNRAEQAEELNQNKPNDSNKQKEL